MRGKTAGKAAGKSSKQTEISLELFTKLYPLNMLLQNKRALAKIVCGSEGDQWRILTIPRANPVDAFTMAGRDSRVKSGSIICPK